ncbi:MAG: glycosyltransferase family 2 protein [Qingshengfaniella sp.]
MLDTTDQKAATALIFMTARNCEMYAAEALRSVSRQTMDDLFILYIDDASEDQTGDIARRYLQDLFPGRHEYIRNPSHYGKSRNTWEHLCPRAHRAEFIAVLDADDQLADASVLRAMAQCYADGKDAVWTNYFTDTGKQGSNAALDPRLSPREQRWVSSHFFSFRASLLPNVPESYFKDSTGAWFMGACDVALAIPILDQTRNYLFIPSLSYRYTSANPLSLHNSTPRVNELTSQVQLKNAKEIREKPPLPLVPKARNKRPAAPVSSQTHQSVGMTATWDIKAADLLVARFPALLTAQSMASGTGLSPLQAWSLAAQIEQQEGDILYLGSPDTALALAAMVSALPGRRMTCLVDPTQGPDDLRARLALVGLAQQVEIMQGRVSTVSMGDKQYASLSCSELQDGAAFSVVVIDPRAEVDEEGLSVTTLPAISEHLAADGFRYCVLSTDSTFAQTAIQKLSHLTSGVNYCLGGLGGTGFVASLASQE